MMKTLLLATIGFAVFTLGPLSIGEAADQCAAQLKEANGALASAPRSEKEEQALRLNEAGALIREAETACRQGDMPMASRKAQEALGLLKSVPTIGRLGGEPGIPPSAKTPGPTRPHESDYYQPSPNVAHDPMFIGPTAKTETGEFGFSAWIAPNIPVGNELAGGWRRQSGTPAMGFTFTWGGPPRRPETIQAP